MRSAPVTSAAFFRPLRWNRRILLGSCVLLLSLDVKKLDEGGSASWQIALVILTFLTASLYLALELSSPRVAQPRSTLRRFAIVWWLYLVVSPVPVLINGVDRSHYVNVLLPFILFGVGLLVMAALERQRRDPAFVVQLLVWGGLVSSLWRVLYALVVSGLSIDSIRWQILSPSVPLLLGFGVAGLFLRRHLVAASFALAVGTICVILSVTRSYLISGLLIVLGLLFIEIRRRSLAYALRVSSKFGLAILAALLVFVAAASYLRPDAVGEWLTRLTSQRTESGTDITLVVRLAEYQGEWHALTKDWLTLLTGNGIGADYVLDMDILAQLAFSTGESSRWFAGHSTWIYPFFASGIFLGMVLPGILFLALVKGVIAASQAGHHVRGTDVLVVTLIFLSYFGQSFTSNILHERYSGLILGLVVGAIFIYSGKSVQALSHSGSAYMRPRRPESLASS